MVVSEGVNKGIGDNDIPRRMNQSLDNDVFVFSALKTNSQLVEASRLLKDEKGRVKSFNKFSQDIKSIRSNYNKNYLEAEYQFAISSAQQAANWVGIEENNGKYNLQYRTASDSQVRQSHEVLHNTTLPTNDPFWDNYYPPNGWRCRCTAVEVRKSKYKTSDSKTANKNGDKATTQIGKSGKNKLEIFRFNPGKKKVIFPPNHPYNKVAGAKIVKSNKDLNYKREVTTKENGFVDVHRNVSRDDSDYQAVYNSCHYFAKKGAKTKVTPKFSATLKNKNYDDVYSDLKGTSFYGKCPDMKVDNNFYEHEGFTTDNPKRAVKNMLNRGLKQSNRVIIEDTGISNRYLLTNIHARIKQGQDIKEVWVKKGNWLTLIFKKAEAE